MKKLIALKMALIIAMLSGSSFTMEPTIHPAFSTDKGPGFITTEFLDSQSKNNLRVVCKEMKKSIDPTIQDIVIYELNEASLVRVTHVATILRSIKINTFNSDFINQNTIFPDFPLLKKLNLKDSDPSVDNVYSIIQNSPQLEELDVTNCDNAAAGIIQALRENSLALQNLKKLKLDQIYFSSKHQFSAILQNCPQLEELDVAICDNAPAGIVRALTAKPLALQHLKKLNLTSTNASASKVHAIIQSCPQLEELNLFSCDNASTGITRAITANPLALQHLKNLNLCATKVSAEQVRTIIKNCQNIEELNVSFCHQASVGIIQALTVNPQALQNLKKLFLNYTGTSDEQKNFIKQLIPHAQI